jgi:BRCT domain type II-containing protein
LRHDVQIDDANTQQTLETLKKPGTRKTRKPTRNKARKCTLRQLKGKTVKAGRPRTAATEPK